MANITFNIVDHNNNPLTSDITIDGVTTTGVDSVVSVSSEDERVVEITVASSGYYGYMKTVRVFDEDIAVTILLAPAIAPGDPGYLFPYLNIFTVKDPCSYDVYIYNGSSSPYNTFYNYINDVVQSNSGDYVFRFPQPGLYTIKQRMVVVTPDTYAIIYDEEAEVDYTVVNIVPELVVELSLPDLLLDSTNYYSLYKPVTATPTLEITNPHCEDPGLLTYQLYNAQDNLVDTYQVPTSVGDLTYTFTPNSIGDHKLKVTLTDCCNPYELTVIVPVSDFVIIKPTTTECKSYNIRNASNSISITVSIAALDGTESQGSTVLLPNEDLDFTFTNDGTYIVDVQYMYESALTIKKYVITAYCGVEDCLANYIIELFCDGDCGCKDTSKLEFTINKMNALMFQYFSHLNELYDFNRSFDVLDGSRLTQFQDADIILKKLQSFCGNSDCGCGCS